MSTKYLKAEQHDVCTCGEYLEQYRDRLLGGTFEYIDGCGVTEKMGSSRK
jgi:hypothetical protein